MNRPSELLSLNEYLVMVLAIERMYKTKYMGKINATANSHENIKFAAAHGTMSLLWVFAPCGCLNQFATVKYSTYF